MNPNITAEIYAQMLDTCAKDMQGDIDRLMLAKYRNNMGYTNYKLTDEQKGKLNDIVQDIVKQLRIEIEKNLDVRDVYDSDGKFDNNKFTAMVWYVGDRLITY